MNLDEKQVKAVVDLFAAINPYLPKGDERASCDAQARLAGAAYRAVAALPAEMQRRIIAATATTGAG